MRPLVIDERVIKELAQLKDYAEDNRFYLEDLYDMVDNTIQNPGERTKHVVRFSFGYKVVFSIEQAKTKQWLRHMSMSVPAKGKLPNSQAVLEISKLLGFVESLEDNHVYIEPIGKGFDAMNVIEAIKV